MKHVYESPHLQSVRVVMLPADGERAHAVCSLPPTSRNQVFIAALSETLGRPHCVSTCVLGTQALCVLLSPAGVRASLSSGSGSQERSGGGRCERDHVSAGKGPDVGSRGQGPPASQLQVPAC